MNGSSNTPAPQDIPSVAQVYLTQRDLCLRWRLSGRTLERWRAEDAGPAWYVIGGSIRYRLEDIEEFELRRRHGAVGRRVSDRLKGGPQ